MSTKQILDCPLYPLSGFRIVGHMARTEQWGRNIREARAALGITQVEFGNLIGVRQSTVARWEAGTDSPTDANKVTIARVLGVDVWVLFPLEEES